MGRYRYIAPLVAAVSWVAVGSVLASGTLSGKHTPVPPSGASPPCLPPTLAHSAALPGTRVDVSPAPGTGSASPWTQISFLGEPAAAIANVAVTGSRSGRHRGRLVGYSQGDGASFLPDRPFRAGERVAVQASVGRGRPARTVSFAFAVATPFPTDGIPQFPNPPAPPSSYQSFLSAPGLHPPLLQVTALDRDPAAGAVMMTAGPGPGQYGPLIFSPQGRLEWFDRLPAGEVAENLSVQRFEGHEDLAFWQGKVLALGFGEGRDIIMDRNYRVVATVRAGNGYKADLHDFQIRGGVAYLPVYNFMRCDLSARGGVRNGVIVDGTVQAVDMKTGLVRWEWHSLDHVDVRESHVAAPKSAYPWDWFHLNSIDPQPGGALLLSARTTWTVYQVRDASGTIAWRLGGRNSSFAMSPASETAWQHDARMHADGTITLFDNGSNPRVHYQSRAMRLGVDVRRRAARLLAVFDHPISPLLADSQGNAQELPSKNTVIGWGAVASVTELSPDRALLFDAHLPPGTSSYRAFRFPWSGRPLWAPGVSAKLLPTGDSTAVFASWNGATDVASWRVLTGETPSRLVPRAKMPDSGFESSVTVPDADPYVAVQALDRRGRVLGTSPTVRAEAAQPAKGA
jgi:Arylsulfotransferase (ASST)